VFSQVNPKFKNVTGNSQANTAHDILSIKTDGSGLERVTKPGPISIIPDWMNNRVLYTELTDRGG
jgi:hypothetical protein